VPTTTRPRPIQRLDRPESDPLYSAPLYLRGLDTLLPPCIVPCLSCPCQSFCMPSLAALPQKYWLSHPSLFANALAQEHDPCLYTILSRGNFCCIACCQWHSLGELTLASFRIVSQLACPSEYSRSWPATALSFPQTAPSNPQTHF
jgi:hypothetical protein